MGRKRYGGRRAAAFIFDLDGTLIDSVADIAASCNVARRRFGLPDATAEGVRSFIGDGVVKLIERGLARDGRPAPAEQIDQGLASFRDHYGRHLLDSTRLYPGVLETLRRFERVPMMVATNKPGAFAREILDGLNVAGAFRLIVGGDEVSAKKPDPEPGRVCLEGLDVDPKDVVVVGDHANDVMLARALGAQSVGAAYGIGPIPRLKAAEPDHLIASFAELADLFPSRSTL